MNNKHFTIFCIVILIVFGNLTSCAAKANTAEMEQQSKSTITWIEDKPGPTLNETTLFPGLPDSLWQSLGLEKGVPASMSCFLLQTDGKNILFDTGLGAPFSRLLPQLAEMGLTPDSIDVIFLTLFHGDHIGGMMRDGKPVFTKAKVYANKVEADAWCNMSDGKGAQAIAMMDAYKNNLHLFTAGDTLEETSGRYRRPLTCWRPSSFYVTSVSEKTNFILP